MKAELADTIKQYECRFKQMVETKTGGQVHNVGCSKPISKKMNLD